MKRLLEIFSESDLLECVDMGAALTGRTNIRTLIQEETARGTKRRATVTWSALLPHQIEGVHWMKMRESDASNAGGILADEMGLGKTITMLANTHYRQTTTNLIVCPAACIGHWLYEINRWIGEGKAFHYKGIPSLNKMYCIVSYTMLLSDFPDGWLFGQRWGRVILDEAHQIRNHGKTGVAAMHILSQIRWAMTGTPVQNSPEDFNALVAFVCSPQGRERTFKSTRGRGRKEPITKSTRGRKQHGNDSTRGTLEPQALYLRREIANTVSLPPKHTELVLIDWCNREEKQRYARLFSEVADCISRRGFQSDVLLYLNNLRFFCSTGIMPRVDVTTPEEEDTEIDVRFAPDGTILETLPAPTPLVDEPLSTREAYNKKYLDEHNVPGKIREVIKLVATIPRNEKIVIFSQWLYVLSVLEEHLQNTVRYDGRMTYDAKGVALETFANDDKKRILLISLKAGNAGINLSCASRVIIVDPWWNPGVEKQAEDRVYRIGQIRPVFVYYLIMRGSIEQQIYDMKNNKRADCATFFDSMESVYRSVLSPYAPMPLNTNNANAPLALYGRDGIDTTESIEDSEGSEEREEKREVTEAVEK